MAKDTDNFVKSSFGWLEMVNYSANPTDVDTDRRGLAFVSGSLKYYNGSTWVAVGSGGGVSTWDELYDNDKTLSIDDTTLTFQLLAGETANALTLAAQATATGACLAFSNSGTGNDVLGTSSTWAVTKAGAATFASVVSESITAAANLTIDATGTGTITIGGTSTGAVTITPALTATASVTITGTADSNCLTVTAGDILVSNGKIAITNDDTDAILTMTAAAVTTGNAILLTANGVTSGNLLKLVTTASGFSGGTFITCDDGSARFSVGVDGATLIASGVNSTKALEITGIQTSENVITVTSSGVTADDKAILLINSSGNSAAGSNQIRIAPSGTPVETSVGIEFVGASKLMQAMVLDADCVDNSVVVINGGGALASTKAVLEVTNDGNLASGGNLARFAIGGTPNAAAVGVAIVGASKALTALSVDADPTASSVVTINGGGAQTDGIAVLAITNDGNLATGGNLLNVTMGGTPHANAIAVEIVAAKDAQALVVTSSAATTDAVAITCAGAIADNKAALTITASGTPAAAGSNVLRVAFTGTATNKPIIAELVGTGKDCSGLYSVTDNTTTHGISIAGAGALASGGTMLTVTNTGTPAANTDMVANITFGGTATNNPIVLKVDNGTADACPLVVTSNVASATRAVAVMTQDSATGAIEVLQLKQDDDDIAFLRLTGTAGSGKSIDSDDKSGGTGVYVKIMINTTAYWIKATPGA